VAIKNDINALPLGYQLHWYEILDIIGRGGFGITYLARDNNLDMLVAIKEYLPEDFASRRDDSTVEPRTDMQSEIYHWGRDRFVTEARILAKFAHPNIVRVISVFEQNNTAYMVMEYAQGEDLSSVYKKRSKNQQPLDEHEYLDIFVPICDGLSLVHKEGFIHRDIKPANIYLCSNAQPLLLDFGSARQSVEHKTRALTSLVTIGYAPFEQYQEGTGKQGPWTDIYSLGASIYVGITGEKPADALERGGHILETGKDTYRPLSQIAADRFSEHFLLAVDNALRFRAEDRPGHILRWADMLLGRVEAPALPEDLYVAIDPAELENTVIMPSDRQSARQSPSGRPTTTAPSRGSQGFVNSLGQRMKDLGDDVEQPVEAGIARLKHLTDSMTSATRRLFSSMPANALFAAAIVLVLIIGLAVILFSIPESRQTSAPPAREQPVTEKPQPENDMTRLMAKARKAYSAGQFTLPRGQSSYDYLQDILAKDANHQPARDLLREMQKHLLQMARADLASGNHSGALGLLEQVLTINPSNADAVSMKKEIDTAQHNAENIRSLLAKAESQLKQKNYVRPKNNSAYFYYRQVLAKDSSNEAATKGLKQLAATLLFAAQSEYRLGHYDSAKLYLDDMATGGFQSAKAQALRTQINVKIDKYQKIARLLSAAKQYIKKNQLTSPEGTNAYASYMQVLKLDSSNAEALAGIENIKQHYENQFSRHIAKMDLNRASFDLQRMKTIAPGSSEVRNMEKTLRQKQQAASRKPEIEQVSELIGQFKQSIELRDMARNRLLSTYQTGREAFVKQLFGQYRTINVKISGFQFISKEHRATAQVELYNLVDKSNNTVRPGAWSKFEISARRNNKGDYRIEW